MAQIAAIFEKIKENFNTTFDEKVEKEGYELIFAPFSTGFTEEDFLFLDTNNASENAHKYTDELFEFSLIANTIPKNDNFWAVSAPSDNLLYDLYQNLIQRLKLLDPDSLKIENLYQTSLFKKALQFVDPDHEKSYTHFYELYQKVSGKIKCLKETINPENAATVNLDIGFKEESLKKILDSWKTKGNKEEIDQNILKLIKEEFEKGFLLNFAKIRGNVIEPSTFIRTNLGSGVDFYLTSCTPNNLYQSNELTWQKVTITRSEIQKLVRSGNLTQYKAILGNTDIDKLDIAEISFELIFVKIIRGWFEEDILESPFWDCATLDADSIKIPCYTDSLIFIRHMNMSLVEDSAVNRKLFKSSAVQNAGPFVINKALFKKGKMLKLHSINKSLNIERKVVHNVASNIFTKQKIQNVKAGKVIQKKHKQFLRLAPQLRRTTTSRFIKPLKPPTHKKALNVKLMHVMKPPILTRIRDHRIRRDKLLAVSMFFKDASTKNVINVLPDQVTITNHKHKSPIKLTKMPNNGIKGEFDRTKNYQINMNVPNYASMAIDLDLSAVSKKSSTLTKVFQLSKMQSDSLPGEELVNELQLIGVVSKKVKEYPNPIKGAEYI